MVPTVIVCSPLWHILVHPGAINTSAVVKFLRRTVREIEVELEGAYSWNRGEAKTQRLWLYTKVLDCWYCNSCTMEHKMYETVCETCAGDPGCTGAERRVSKRRRTKR